MIEISSHDKRYAEFLMTFKMLDLIGQDGVLFIGDTGEGKSTAITILLGGNFQYNEDTSYSLLNPEENKYPEMSTGVKSQTLSVSGWRNEHQADNLVYIDTGGFHDNRGPDEKKWNRYCSRLLFHTVRSFKSIVVTVNSALLKGREGPGIILLAEECNNLSFGLKNFYDNMVFLVTKEQVNYSVKDVRKHADKLVKSVRDNLRRTIKELEERFPLSSAEKKEFEKEKGPTLVGTIVSGARFLRKEAMTFIGVDEIKEFDLDVNYTGFSVERAKADTREGGKDLYEKLQNLFLRLRLYQALAKQPIVFCKINGVAECTSTRNNLNKAIHETHGMSASLLKEINKKVIVDEGFRLQSIVCQLASIYLPYMARISPVLQQFTRQHAVTIEREARLRANQDNWQAIRDEENRSAREKINSLTPAIVKKRESLAKLEAIKEATLRSEPLVQSILWYNRLLLWAAYAEAEYEYPDKESENEANKYNRGVTIPFTRDELNPLPGSHYEIIQGPEKGEDNSSYKIKIRSHWQKDLNAHLTLFTDKALAPSIIRERKNLTAIIDSYESRVKLLRIYQNNLTRVYDINSLQRVLNSEENALKQLLLEHSRELAEELAETGFNHYPVIKGIVEFFTLLKKIKLIDPEVQKSNTNTINDFIELDRQIRRELVEHNEGGYVTAKIPTLGYNTQLSPITFEYKDYLQNEGYFQRLCTQFSSYQLPIGGALSLTALLMFTQEMTKLFVGMADTCWSGDAEIGIFIIFGIGIYMVLKELKKYADNISFTLSGQLNQAGDAIEMGAVSLSVAARDFAGAARDYANSGTPIVHVPVDVTADFSTACSFFGSFLLKSIFPSETPKSTPKNN